MSLKIAARIARRELRGGLAGFRIFLLCLALGVAAIAAVGSVGSAINAGLSKEGAALLGGDAQLEFTYRFATVDERAWMQKTAIKVSEVVDFRSMAVVDATGGAERALTQVKAVDTAYPLVGNLRLSPAMPLSQALAGQDGLPGAVMQRVLVDRLGLALGKSFKLGTQNFRLMAILENEPDNATGGFSLGPRTIVATPALKGSGLLVPGTLFDTKYRMTLPPGSNLDALEAKAKTRFRDTGARWHDARNGAPGVQQFVDRLGSFLILVGLAGLAVGGVGVSAAVRAYLGRKTGVIATLKTLGADRRVIFLTYFLQVGVLALAGIAGGLILGAVLPLVFSPLMLAALPIPAVFSIYPGALAEAAVYGVLAALLFTLWPLAKTEDVRPAALFREATGHITGWPRPVFFGATLVILAALVGAAAWFSGAPWLAIWAAVGVSGALAVLGLAALVLRRLSKRLAGIKALHGHTSLRLALGAIGGPGEAAASVVLSLGLGLAVLAAIGQIDSNLRGAIARDLPKIAPSYFFVDIQDDQIAGFRARLAKDPSVTRVDTAPMLRGVISQINGRPAREVGGDHWALRGDRGITFSDQPPPGTKITSGTWWPSGYTGPPQISFATKEAQEIGLKLGDMLTVNVLGRDIKAKITSFRDVNFSTAGIGFVLTIDPAALAGAPHTSIATVYATPASEAAILRDLAQAYPNITAIRVRDAIDRVSAVLSGIAAAVSFGAAATLVTGFVVLIGAAAAGEGARVYEAAVLKTIGASRRTILTSFALRSVILGAAAGLVAIVAGITAGWAVMRYVMESDFQVAWLSAISIVVGGILAVLLAGLAFAWRPLAARPAQVLRARE